MEGVESVDPPNLPTPVWKVWKVQKVQSARHPEPVTVAVTERRRKTPTRAGEIRRFLRAQSPIALPEVAPFDDVGTQGVE